MTVIVQCPTCKKPVEYSEKSPYRPFCCKRCRLIDLGAWASEEHSIPGDPTFDDVLSEDLTPKN
ncbi:DNA gyrase inhibitor YacG [Endozoicomonadaceae bacterium StTr2]